MRRTALIVSLLAVLVLALGALAASADSSRNYVAHLESDNSAGQGQAIFQFDGNTVSYRLNVANIENVTQAHIHIAAAPGGNGPIFVWLYPSQPPLQLIPGRSDGVLNTGSITLTTEQVTTLRAALEAGTAYVNVHTSLFPGGEIRGDIH